MYLVKNSTNMHFELTRGLESIPWAHILLLDNHN